MPEPLFFCELAGLLNMMLNINIDKGAPFKTSLQKCIAYIVWMAGSVFFFVGFWFSFPSKEVDVDVTILLLAVLAQILSIRRYKRTLVIEDFLIICAMTYWGLGFALRKTGLI